MDYTKLLSYVDDFNKIYSAGSNVMQIVSFLSGDADESGNLLSSMQQLQNEIQKDFNKLIDAIEDQTLTENWISNYGNPLSSMFNTWCTVSSGF